MEIDLKRLILFVLFLEHYQILNFVDSAFFKYPSAHAESCYHYGAGKLTFELRHDNLLLADP